MGGILLLIAVWLLVLVVALDPAARRHLALYTRRGYLHDPISGTAILVSLAISAAVSAATYGLQRLLIRPKTIKQNRAGDSVLIQDSAFGLYINEVYGQRPADGKGGIQLAGNVIDASNIRAVTTTSTAESGGKGAPKQKVEKTSYFQDLDIAFGRGRLRFLKIKAVGGAGSKVIYDITQSSGATGIIDQTFDPPDPQDYFLPPDPQAADTYPSGRYGFVPTPDTEGMVEAQIVGGGGATIRLYDGGEDQLPDPLFESIHGVGSTPAYRGLAHIVLENYDITDGHPTFLAVVENMDYGTFEEIAAARSLMAGLEASDVDFSDLSSKEIRGYLVSQRQAPRADMELLGRIYDADFYEGPNGKVNGVLVSESIEETLDEDYLGAGQETELAVSVQNRSKDEVDLPFRLDLNAYDPDNNHETATRHATRQVTTSRNHETLDLPLTLTVEELQMLANRELQEMWREQGSYVFTTTHRYRHLLPSMKITVPFGGQLKNMRIKERTGSVPGFLTFTCVPADGIVLDSIGDATPLGEEQLPAVPANTVITLIDIPRVHSPQDVPGFMWAAAPRDQDSGEWSRAALYVDKGAGTKLVDVADGPATMGRVTGSALADVPGGWDPGEWDATSTVTVDLFYGELETVTEAQVLDGDNVFVIGDEMVGVRTWVSVGGHPNRWTGTNMQRRLKDTVSNTHVTGERIVLLNNAVRFVKVDESEQDVARTYYAPTIAPQVSQPLIDAAPVDFTWTGQTIVTEGEFTAIEADTVLVNDYNQFSEVAAPATPSAGNVAVYAKTDSKLYLKTDAGVEIDLTSAADPTFTPSTPAQITADQNNYNPGTGSFFRLSSDASRTITGIVAGTPGQSIQIANIGAQNIVFANQDALSTAANRIITGTGASVTLVPDDTATLIYDSVTQRWRMFA